MYRLELELPQSLGIIFCRRSFDTIGQLLAGQVSAVCYMVLVLCGARLFETKQLAIETIIMKTVTSQLQHCFHALSHAEIRLPRAVVLALLLSGSLSIVGCQMNGVAKKSGAQTAATMPGVQTSATAPATQASVRTSGVRTHYKAAQVEHFTQADGVGLSQAFVDSFQAGFQERAQKARIADQTIDEGATVPDADAANTVVVEGKFLSLKSRAFGVTEVDMEIKLYRQSDHTLIQNIPVQGAFRAGIIKNDTASGKLCGGNTAFDVGKALN